MESKIPAAQPLSSQVGGHAGVLETEDGSLIIKPALPIELKFYQELQHNPELASLRRFTPKFIGTLKLEGQLDETKPSADGSMKIMPIDAPEKECLVVENLSYPFLKPNILDVKLGTVLYDRFAVPDKVERMIKAARNTTSLETGIRLTGFQVYNNITGQAVVTSKAYGKSIQPSQLPEGIKRFFPVHEPLEGNKAAKSTYGLPLSTLLPILIYIKEEIKNIRENYSEHEIRMVGGSLLIIYEADWDHAAKRLEYVDSESEEESEEEEVIDLGTEDDSPKAGPPFVVKLIDFAHTHLAPGEGPDEGVLLGLDTILRLINDRILELS